MRAAHLVVVVVVIVVAVAIPFALVHGYGLVEGVQARHRIRVQR